MTQKGMSQNRLAELSGVGQRRISQTIGLNARSLDLTELDRICEALGVSAEIVVSTAEKVSATREEYKWSSRSPRAGYFTGTPGSPYPTYHVEAPEGYELAARGGDDDDDDVEEYP